MKIVYITEVNIDAAGGVLNKLNTQIESWVKSGNEIHVISLPTIADTSGSKILLTSAVTSYRIFRNKILSRFCSNGAFNFLNKACSVRNVKKHIDNINPDVIYVREMVGFPGVNNMFGSYPVILESNTVLKKELRASSYKVRLFFRAFQHLLNKRSNGFIGVTDEITKVYAGFGKPSVTIGNSIHIDRSLTYNAPFNTNPRLIFVGSPGCVWHGVDKFVQMAKLFPSVDFFLVGPVLPDVVLPNLVQKGFLSKSELEKLYHTVDIAVGSLALYRNEMKQACPLKVREYLSQGLPTIIAYEDKDLKDQHFVLELENKETSIENSIDLIQEFVDKWRGKRIKMSDIYPLISSDVKEAERLRFMEKISESRHL